jgi:hypothetical protein
MNKTIYASCAPIYGRSGRVCSPISSDLLCLSVVAYGGIERGLWRKQQRDMPQEMCVCVEREGEGERITT